MASHRMLSYNVMSSDKYFGMSKGAKCLYPQLVINADDDGFLANPRCVTRMAGCSPEELEELVTNGYLISFPSGNMVIRHWRMHNFLRKEIYRPSIRKERDLLCWNKNGVYFLKEEVKDKQSTGEFHTFDEIKKKKARKSKAKACPEPEPMEEAMEEAAEECPVVVAEPVEEETGENGAPHYPLASFAGPLPLTGATAAERPSSLLALRSSLAPGSPLVSTWLPKDRAMDRERGYSQRQFKKSLRLHCDRREIPRYCSTLIGEEDVLQYDSNNNINKYINKTMNTIVNQSDYLDLGPHGLIVVPRELAGQLQDLFPTTWEQRLAALEERRIKRREKFGYGYHWPISPEEKAELFGVA